MATKALRVLGMAVKFGDLISQKGDVAAEEAETDMVFVGLAGMIDPLAPKSRTPSQPARERA